MEAVRDDASRPARSATAILAVAVTAGILHGLVSLYWAAGGTWLLSTLGHQLVETFAGRRWLLLPVAAVKLGFAVLPVLLIRRRLFGVRAWRMLCWAGGILLAGWGGVNTLVGNLVLGGFLRPAGGYDREGMVGHAWLWDPLLLVWGATLIVVLLLTGRRGLAHAVGHGTSGSSPDQNGQP